MVTLPAKIRSSSGKTSWHIPSTRLANNLGGSHASCSSQAAGIVDETSVHYATQLELCPRVLSGRIFAFSNVVLTFDLLALGNWHCTSITKLLES